LLRALTIVCDNRAVEIPFWELFTPLEYLLEAAQNLLCGYRDSD